MAEKVAQCCSICGKPLYLVPDTFKNHREKVMAHYKEEHPDVIFVMTLIKYNLSEE